MLAQRPEFFTVKLGTVVSDDGSRYAEAGDDVCPRKLHDAPGSDSAKCFRFYLLGEVVDGHDHEALAPRGRREWPHKVHSPEGKGARAGDGSKPGGRLPWDVAEALALITSTHVVFGVGCHGGPVVT